MFMLFLAEENKSWIKRSWFGWSNFNVYLDSFSYLQSPHILQTYAHSKFKVALWIVRNSYFATKMTPGACSNYTFICDYGGYNTFLQSKKGVLSVVFSVFMTSRKPYLTSICPIVNWSYKNYTLFSDGTKEMYFRFLGSNSSISNVPIFFLRCQNTSDFYCEFVISGYDDFLRHENSSVRFRKESDFILILTVNIFCWFQ